MSGLHNFDAEITVQLENDEVYFLGEAVTDKYVTDKELGEINKWFMNQPVVYRHDHPAKGDGGSIYGRVVESEIIEKEDKTKSLRFKSLMKQDLQKHKDLITLAEKQQEMEKPIRYSIAFTSHPKTSAEVYELAITNDPVCKECENTNIMEENTMGKEKVEEIPEVNLEKEIAKRDAVIADLQKNFEASIDFKKEFEAKDEELKTLEKELKEKTEVLEESKEIFKAYESRITQLESKADLAERAPYVEKIFVLENSAIMKERYLKPELWSIEELKGQYEEVKVKNKHKIQTQGVSTRTVEQSRHRIMEDSSPEKTREFEEKMRTDASDELKKLMGWN